MSKYNIIDLIDQLYSQWIGIIWIVPVHVIGIKNGLCISFVGSGWGAGLIGACHGLQNGLNRQDGDEANKCPEIKRISVVCVVNLAPEIKL